MKMQWTVTCWIKNLQIKLNEPKQRKYPLLAEKVTFISFSSSFMLFRFAIYIQMLMQAQPVICNQSHTVQLKVQNTTKLITTWIWVIETYVAVLQQRLRFKAWARRICDKAITDITQPSEESLQTHVFHTDDLLTHNSIFRPKIKK